MMHRKSVASLLLVLAITSLAFVGYDLDVFAQTSPRVVINDPTGGWAQNQPITVNVIDIPANTDPDAIERLSLVRGGDTALFTSGNPFTLDEVGPSARFGFYYLDNDEIFDGNRAEFLSTIQTIDGYCKAGSSLPLGDECITESGNPEFPVPKKILDPAGTLTDGIVDDIPLGYSDGHYGAPTVNGGSKSITFPTTYFGESRPGPTLQLRDGALNHEGFVIDLDTTMSSLRPTLIDTRTNNGINLLSYDFTSLDAASVFRESIDNPRFIEPEKGITIALVVGSGSKIIDSNGDLAENSSLIRLASIGDLESTSGLGNNFIPDVLRCDDLRPLEEIDRDALAAEWGISPDDIYIPSTAESDDTINRVCIEEDKVCEIKTVYKEDPDDPTQTISEIEQVCDETRVTVRSIEDEPYHSAGVVPFTASDTALARIFDATDPNYISDDASIGIAYIPRLTHQVVGTLDGDKPIAIDFMSFGFENDGDQSTDQIANQIVRLEPTEVDIDQGQFTGTLSYVLLNQTNLLDPDTYTSQNTDRTFATLFTHSSLSGDDTSIEYGGARDSQDMAPTVTGSLRLDAFSYHRGSTITITVTDSDLNADPTAADTYSNIVITDDHAIGTLGYAGFYDDDYAKTPGILLSVDIDGERWVAPDLSYNGVSCSDSLDSFVGLNGLNNLGFELTETGANTGIFEGSFILPSNYCKRTDSNGDPASAGVATSLAGTSLFVQYFDYQNAQGVVSSTNASATIGENEPPTITIDPLVVYHAVGETYTSEGVSAVDADGDTITPTLQDDNLDANTVGTYKQTFVATDDDGLSATLSRTIHVAPAPTITTLTLELLLPNDPAHCLTNPVGNLCPLDPASIPTNTPSPDDKISPGDTVYPQYIDYMAGTIKSDHEVTIRANYSYLVPDNRPIILHERGHGLVIELPNNEVMNIPDPLPSRDPTDTIPPTTIGVTAVDSDDNSLDVTVDIGDLDVNVTGTYMITFTATDDDGPSATTTRTIHVYGLKLVGDSVISRPVDLDMDYTIEGVTVENFATKTKLVSGLLDTHDTDGNEYLDAQEVMAYVEAFAAETAGDSATPDNSDIMVSAFRVIDVNDFQSCQGQDSCILDVTGSAYNQLCRDTNECQTITTSNSRHDELCEGSGQCRIIDLRNPNLAQLCDGEDMCRAPLFIPSIGCPTPDDVCVGPLTLANAQPISFGNSGTYEIHYIPLGEAGYNLSKPLIRTVITTGDEGINIDSHKMYFPVDRPFVDPSLRILDENLEEVDLDDVELTFTVGNSPFDTSTFGESTVTYTATFTDENDEEQTYTATRDVQIFGIKLSESSGTFVDPIFLDVDDTYTAPTITAQDRNGDDISSNISISSLQYTFDNPISTDPLGANFTNTPGLYKQIYEIDLDRSLDHISSYPDVLPVGVVRTIAVGMPSLFSPIGDNPQAVPLGTTFVDQGARFIQSICDVCSFTLVQADPDDIAAIDTDEFGTHTITYTHTYTDDNFVERTITTERTVHVYGIQLKGENNIEIEAGERYREPGTIAYNIHGENISDQVQITDLSGTCFDQEGVPKLPSGTCYDANGDRISGTPDRHRLGAHASTNTRVGTYHLNYFVDSVGIVGTLNPNGIYSAQCDSDAQMSRTVTSTDGMSRTVTTCLEIPPAIRTIEIVDTTKPTITFDGGSTVIVPVQSRDDLRPVGSTQQFLNFADLTSVQVDDNSDSSTFDLVTEFHNPFRTNYLLLEVCPQTPSNCFDRFAPSAGHLQYTAVDSSRNTATENLAVIVYDDTNLDNFDFTGNQSTGNVPVGGTYVDIGLAYFDDDGDLDTVDPIYPIDEERYTYAPTTINTSTAGTTHTITYTLTNTAGETIKTLQRQITVVDTDVPATLVLKGSDPISHRKGLSYTDPGITILDGSATPITMDDITITNIDPDVAGPQTITYTAGTGSDAISVSRTVNVYGINAQSITLEAGDVYEDGQTVLDEDGDETTISISAYDANGNAIPRSDIQYMRHFCILPQGEELEIGTDFSSNCTVPDNVLNSVFVIEDGINVDAVNTVPGDYIVGYTVPGTLETVSGTPGQDDHVTRTVYPPGFEDPSLTDVIIDVTIQDTTPPTIDIGDNSVLVVPVEPIETDRYGSGDKNPSIESVARVFGYSIGFVDGTAGISTNLNGITTLYNLISHNFSVSIDDNSIDTIAGQCQAATYTVPINFAVTFDCASADNTDHSAISVSVELETQNGNIPNFADFLEPGVSFITYTATDSSGNSASVTRTIINYNDDPNRPVNTPALRETGRLPVNTDQFNFSDHLDEITIAVGSEYLEPGVSYFEYDTDKNVYTGYKLSSKLYDIMGSVDTDTAGTYTLTYSVKNSGEIRKLTVEPTGISTDMTPSTITPPQGPTIIPAGIAFNATSGVVALDSNGNDISSSLRVSIEPTTDVNDRGNNTFLFGKKFKGNDDVYISTTTRDYTITYTVDDNGNTITATRVITVSAVPNYVAPGTEILELTRTVNVVAAESAIVLNGPSVVSVPLGGTYTEQGATFGDDTIMPDQTVDTERVGTYTLTYFAGEGADRVSTSRTVYVFGLQVFPSQISLEASERYIESGVIALSPSGESLTVNAYDLDDLDSVQKYYAFASSSDSEDDLRNALSSGLFHRQPGTYEIHYRVPDFDFPPVKRTINVYDNTPPIIEFSNNAPSTLLYPIGDTPLATQQQLDKIIAATSAVVVDPLPNGYTLITPAPHFIMTDASSIGFGDRIDSIVYFGMDPAGNLAAKTQTVIFYVPEDSANPNVDTLDNFKFTDDKTTSTVPLGGKYLDPGVSYFTNMITGTPVLDEFRPAEFTRDVEENTATGYSLDRYVYHSPDTSTAGTFEVDYTVHTNKPLTIDEENNLIITEESSPVTTITRTITIEPFPSITVNPPIVRIVKDTVYDVFTGVSATDPHPTQQDITSDIVRTISPETGFTVDGSNYTFTAPGTYTITYNVTDSDGNKAAPKTRTLVISATDVVDLTPPTISVPEGDTYILPDTEFNVLSGVSANDRHLGVDTDLTTSITHSISPSTGFTNNGDVYTFDALAEGESIREYTITYNVLDPSPAQNPAVPVSRTVIVSSAPSITVTAETASIRVGQNVPHNDNAGVTATDRQDGNITSSIERTVSPETGFAVSGTTYTFNTVGTYTITYNVQDSDGFDAEPQTREIRVTPPPALTVDPSSDVATVNAPYDVYTGVTITDDGNNISLAGNIVFTVFPDHRNHSVAESMITFTESGTYLISYSYTNSISQTVTETRTITVSDEPPSHTITLDPQTVNLTAGSTYNALTGVTVDPAVPTSDITFEVNPQTGRTITGSDITFNDEGTYQIRYNITGGTNIPFTLRIVEVSPSMASHTITVNPLNVNLTTGSTYNALTGVTVDPSVDNSQITIDVQPATGRTITGFDILFAQADTYTITYGVMGGTDIVQPMRTLVVSDPGSITVPSRAVDVNLSDSHDDSDVTATDDQGMDITGNITRSISPSTGFTFNAQTLVYTFTGPGTYTITYTAPGVPDATRTITVSDDILPVIAVDPTTNRVSLGQPYNDNVGVTASDNNGQVDLTSDINRTVLPSTGFTVSGTTYTFTVPETYTITYNVSDAAGNPADPKTRTIVISNADAPTITLTGDNPFLIRAGSTYTDAGATAIDAEDGELVVTTNTDNVLSTPGVYTVSYTVQDLDQNSASATRTVIVFDSTNVANFRFTDQITSETSTVGERYMAPSISYFDNGASYEIPSSRVSSTGMVEIETAGEYTLEFTLTDSGGTAISGTSLSRTVNVVARADVASSGGGGSWRSSLNAPILAQYDVCGTNMAALRVIAATQSGNHLSMRVMDGSFTRNADDVSSSVSLTNYLMGHHTQSDYFVFDTPIPSDAKTFSVRLFVNDDFNQGRSIFISLPEQCNGSVSLLESPNLGTLVDPLPAFSASMVDGQAPVAPMQDSSSTGSSNNSSNNSSSGASNNNSSSSSNNNSSSSSNNNSSNTGSSNIETPKTDSTVPPRFNPDNNNQLDDPADKKSDSLVEKPIAEKPPVIEQEKAESIIADPEPAVSNKGTDTKTSPTKTPETPAPTNQSEPDTKPPTSVVEPTPEPTLEPVVPTEPIVEQSDEPQEQGNFFENFVNMILRWFGLT